jgi:aspartate ammonia-lyase
METVIRLLSAAAPFAGLPDEAVRGLAALARRRTLAPGAVLFRQDTPRAALYLIEAGRVELSREGARGGGPLIVLGAGELFGESALLHATDHSTSARALDEVTLHELPRAEVLAHLSRDGALAVELLSRLALAMTRRLQFASPREVGLDKAYASATVRREHDQLGERDVPADALFGVQTLRGVENFPITGVRLSHFPTLIRTLALVKRAAARANARLGLLEPALAGAIDRACQEIADGHWHGHFVVDMVQGGAGTSTNMNANEVVANRALELLGRSRGDYRHCHPNDHVNLSQSTNDVYPTAVRLAVVISLRELIAAMTALQAALADKGAEFAPVLKMGRTQLQDAVPMTLGQEFTAFAVTTAEDIARLEETARLFLEVNIGGTAIGTGINADPRYQAAVIEELRALTGLPVVPAENLVEATPDMGAFVMFSGVLKRVAVKLSKLCNDLRLLSSGPRCGLGEINLPAVQPGSTIMPGKVNPVIPEVVNQIAFQVIGNDLTVTLAAEAGQLQLNVMEPIIAFNIFQSLDILAAGVRTLTDRCVRGITANAEHCRAMVEGSIGIVTALVPALGYQRAGEIARAALETGRSVREIALAAGDLPVARLDELLSPEAMVAPRPLAPGGERLP